MKVPGSNRNAQVFVSSCHGWVHGKPHGCSQVIYYQSFPLSILQPRRCIKRSESGLINRARSGGCRDRLNRVFARVQDGTRSSAANGTTMNSSVRFKPLPPGSDEPKETRAEKLRRVREQVKNGYYSERDVMKDVADALIMNPTPFEVLNEKEEDKS